MTTEATIPHVLGEATLGELEQGLRGQLVRPGDDGYDEARADLERRARPAAGADRPLRRRRRRHARGRLRAQREPHRRRPRRRAFASRLLDLRRRHRHRPVGHERGARRPGAPHGRRRGRLHLGGLRPRDPGVRARGHRRARVQHRDRRVHARRRHRLADAQGRPDLRQPDRRRRRHRRRPARARERGREPRAAVGPARRRRELRHRDLARVPAASRRTDAAGRPDLLRRRPRRTRSCASTATGRASCPTR